MDPRAAYQQSDGGVAVVPLTPIFQGVHGRDMITGPSSELEHGFGITPVLFVAVPRHPVADSQVLPKAFKPGPLDLFSFFPSTQKQNHLNSQITQLL